MTFGKAKPENFIISQQENAANGLDSTFPFPYKAVLSHNSPPPKQWKKSCVLKPVVRLQSGGEEVSESQCEEAGKRVQRYKGALEEASLAVGWTEVLQALEDAKKQ